MMDMSDHFNLPEGTLQSLKIPIKEQMEAAKMFRPSEEYQRGRTENLHLPVTPIGLLHYIDNASPAFMVAQPKSHHKIAKVFFDNMESKYKVNVLQYIEIIEDEEDD